MKTIVNGAPGVVDYGVQDLSIRPYSRAPEDIPQHCPKYFIFAQKGPESEELLVGNERILMYGEDTFVQRSKYFNHVTMHSNGVNAQGNTAMYVRMIPPDVGPKPTIRVWLDVLPTKVDQYERNKDGSIKTDIAGDPIVVGQIDGFRVKFVSNYFHTKGEAENFGQANVVAGDQVDTGTGVQSERYPIFELEHSFYGEDGNFAGIRMWAQNTDNTVTLPNKMIAKERAYPFNFGVIRKSVRTGTAKYVGTTFTEQNILVTFKPDTVDPLTY